MPVISHLKNGGVKVIPVVPSSRLAKKMEDNGADAVVVEGLESGGHIGESTTLALVPQAKEKLERIPLIGAGGIYNGRTAKSVMDLGADGVQIGTRFLASFECLVHQGYKEAIIKATDEDIVVLARFTGHPIRVIKNNFSEKVKKLEQKNPFPEEMQAEKMAGARIISGDISQFPLLCGICAGSISDVKSCKEIIEEIAKEI